MDNSEFITSTLSKLDRQAKALSKRVTAELETYSTHGLSEDFYTKAIGYTSNLMKNLYLLAYTVRKDPAEMIQGIRSAQIDIRVEKQSVLLRLPYLMPRGRTGPCPLYDALLSTLSVRKNLPPFDRLHIDFIHCYPTAVKEMPKDVDNWEYKKVIDIIAFCMGVSDCPVSFDMAMTTIFRDNCKPGVYIQIAQKSSDFPGFYGFLP